MTKCIIYLCMHYSTGNPDFRKKEMTTKSRLSTFWCPLCNPSPLSRCSCIIFSLCLCFVSSLAFECQPIKHKVCPGKCKPTKSMAGHCAVHLVCTLSWSNLEKMNGMLTVVDILKGLPCKIWLSWSKLIGRIGKKIYTIIKKNLYIWIAGTFCSA